MRHEVTRRILAGMTALSATAILSVSSFAQAPTSSSSDAASQPPAQQTQTQAAAQPAPRTQVQFARHIPVTYDNRWETYGGFSFMNFQAGQNLPKRMNMGGIEAQATYWLTDRIGPAVDFRAEFGTTPVLPNPYNINRPYVRQWIGMAGAHYRAYQNQHFAIQYHGLIGASYGKFDGGTRGGINSPSTDAAKNALTVGLYSNRTKPIGAFGGSINFNGSRRWAIRLQPDLIVEHFGSEYRQFFSISTGLVWRFGHRDQ